MRRGAGAARRRGAGGSRVLLAAGLAIGPVGLSALLACDVSRPVRSELEPSCAAFPTELTVASDCDVRQAALRVTQTGCAIALTITGADRVELEGRLEGDGQLVLEPGNALGCAEIPPRTEALRSIQCARSGNPCTYDLQPVTVPRPLVVDQLAVVEAPFQAPGKVATHGVRPLDELHPRAGYLQGLVVLGPDLAWVATASGAYATVDCRGTEPAQVVRVDGSDRGLARGPARTAPPCLVELTRDPLDPLRFLGVSGGPQVRLHRFDAEGRLLASVDAPALASREAGQHVVVIGLVAGETVDTLGLVVSTRDKQLESWLVTLRSDTLAAVRVSQPGPTPVRATTPVVRGRVFTADHTTGAVLPFHAADLGFDPAFTLDVVGGPTDDAGYLGLHAASGRLLISTTGDESVVYVADERSSPFIRGYARFYERDARPWASASWPPDDGQMVVGMTESEAPFGAYLARLVIEERRFLPGATPIGRGAVRAIETDARGQLWVLLPWTGELLRITP